MGPQLPSRRSILKAGAATGGVIGAAGLGISSAAADEDTGAAPPRPVGSPGSMIGVPFDAYGDQVRVGIVGVGNRGTRLLEAMLQFPEVRVTAVCDINPPRVHHAAEMVQATGQPEPARYSGRGGHWQTPQENYELAVHHSKLVRAGTRPDPDADDDYRALCARDDVDIVVNASSWEWHHPVCMTAMLNGKHAATEVPLAMELEHLWDLVNTSEAMRRHCIMLEQVVYGRTELRLLRMAHDGLFGDLLVGAGGYHNEGRAAAFNSTGGTRYPEGWRRRWWYRRDGDFYSMHGVGPVAAYMDINRGDRFESIVSMSSPAIGLTAFREQHVPPEDAGWNDPPYIKGDRTLSQVMTAKGRVIQVSHDETVPQPYTRVNWLAGTQATFNDDPPRIFVDGTSDNGWDDLDDYGHYDHWLWEIDAPLEEHMFRRLFQTMRLGLVPDIDVYDSATWSVQIPLSTESIRRGNRPVRVPDFTRGQWEEYRDGLDRPNPEG